MPTRPRPRRTVPRAWPFAGLAAVMALAACGSDGRAAGDAPDGDRWIPGPAQASMAEPSAQATAALAPLDTISPVPAFRGGDGDWRIEIQSVGDLRHEVVLSQGRARMTGMLTYRPLPGEDASGPLDLSGALRAPRGDAPMQVHLQPETCIDAAGAHAWTVRVDVEGHAPRAGCGDLAM